MVKDPVFTLPTPEGVVDAMGLVRPEGSFARL